MFPPASPPSSSRGTEEALLASRPDKPAFGREDSCTERGACGGTVVLPRTPSEAGPSITADRRHGSETAGHRVGRGAVAARGGRRLVRVPRVHAGPDGDAIRRGGAVGVGPPLSAAPRGSSPSLAPASRGGVTTGPAHPSLRRRGFVPRTSSWPSREPTSPRRRSPRSQSARATPA